MKKSQKSKKVLICFIYFLLVMLFYSPFLLAQENKGIKSDTIGQKISRVTIDDEGITFETKDGKIVEFNSDKVITNKKVVEKITLPGVVISTDTEETPESQINIRIPDQPTVITIEQGDIVKFFENITVEEEERFSGDVVAIGGSIQVKGYVKGSAVAIGGNVYVAPTGVVLKDAVSVGGKLIKEPGAVVKGESVGVNFLPEHLIIQPIPIYISHGFGFILSIIKVLFILFMGIIVLAIVPKNIQKLKDKITENAWKSLFIGILGEILILPLFVILLITVIGIPVALLVLPLGVLLGMLLGYVGVSLLVGEKLKQNISLKPQTQVMTLVLGILAVESASLLSGFLRIFSDLFAPLSLILTLIGIMICYSVVTIGFGGAIQSRLGSRPKDEPLKDTPVQPEPAPPQVQT